MDKQYQDDLERLKAIHDKIIALLAKPEPSPDDTVLFYEICSDIYSLPEEYKMVISESLSTIGSGPGMLKKWALSMRAPLQALQPLVLRAFDRGMKLFAGESPQAREFRKFYTLAHQMAHAALRAKCGTEWDDNTQPREPVQAYIDETIGFRDLLVAQFEKLDEPSIALIDEQLLRMRPFIVAEDLSAPEFHDDPEAMAGIISSNREFNRQSIAQVAPYQSGLLKTRDIIEDLRNAWNPEKLCDRAGALGTAVNIYYPEDPPPPEADTAPQPRAIDSITAPETPDPSKA
jgi:hypothetical protein